MTTKRRLITDSYKVVKKERRGGKRKKSPTPPPPPQGILSLSKTPLNNLVKNSTAISPRHFHTSTDAESEIHKEELQKLKEFDLDWRFGPCTGVSRMQRWERAKLHGLNPPEEIRKLLLQSQTDPEYQQSLWSEYPL